jgi:hypothetical protein
MRRRPDECGYCPTLGQTIHTPDCLVAQVVAKATKSDTAIVGHFETFLVTGGTAVRYLTGENMRRWIVEFEETGELKPCDRLTLRGVPEDYDDPVARPAASA